MGFFALSGFLFLIILYFQIMRGYSALETGVRVLPVALSLAAASGLGTVAAVRIGNKIVVAAGPALGIEGADGLAERRRRGGTSRVAGWR